MSERRRRGPPAPLAPERAWEYALQLLGRQAYSAAELERRLLRRSLDPEHAARVVARLIELRLLDDAGYAGAYVRSRRSAKGPIALRQELRRKGVDERHVEAALAEEGSDDPVATALALLQRNAWRYQGVACADDASAQAARRRALAFLARRGFEPDTASEALERWRRRLEATADLP